MSDPARWSQALACADIFRGEGRILASAFGLAPRLGARLAKATFAPELVLTDGGTTIVDAEGNAQGHLSFSRVFDLVWSGRRHAILGASQLDRHGNANLSCIGDWNRPKVQLLGSRGLPGNTRCHGCSYWVPKHGPRVLVETVDFVSGLGTNRGAFELRRLVTDLGVFDFAGPDGTLRLLTLHPGATVDQVQERTGFAVHVTLDLGESRGPTPQELDLLQRWTA
jgi:acyl CoA:acetate/3-ketoacid CoA transferase beta subunit